MASTSDQERMMIREELSSMSFEELEQLKEKLGTKVVNKALFGTENQGTRKHVKRENKNRPRETSSKIPVSAVRPIATAKKSVSRDPRFDDLSGTFNEQIFKSAYNFIDDIKVKEKTTLEKQFRKEKDPKMKQKIKSLLQGMDSKEKSDKSKVIDDEREKNWRHQQIDKIKQGQQPYFLKKSDKRKMDLAEKFQSLKKSGKLEQYIAKKRKKNARIDRTKLPKP